jgi:hypothetical protein
MAPQDPVRRFQTESSARLHDPSLLHPLQPVNPLLSAGCGVVTFVTTIFTKIQQKPHHTFTPGFVPFHTLAA